MPNRRIRRRRRAPSDLPGGPDELVAVSCDIPRWLYDVLEAESENSGYSRASVMSDWLEDRARKDIPDKVRRFRDARG